MRCWTAARAWTHLARLWRRFWPPSRMTSFRALTLRVPPGAPVQGLGGGLGFRGAQQECLQIAIPACQLHEGGAPPRWALCASRTAARWVLRPVCLPCTMPESAEGWPPEPLHDCKPWSTYLLLCRAQQLHTQPGPRQQEIDCLACFRRAARSTAGPSLATSQLISTRDLEAAGHLPPDSGDLLDDDEISATQVLQMLWCSSSESMAMCADLQVTLCRVLSSSSAGASIAISSCQLSSVRGHQVACAVLQTDTRNLSAGRKPEAGRK